MSPEEFADRQVKHLIQKKKRAERKRVTRSEIKNIRVICLFPRNLTIEKSFRHAVRHSVNTGGSYGKLLFGRGCRLNVNQRKFKVICQHV